MMGFIMGFFGAMAAWLTDFPAIVFTLILPFLPGIYARLWGVLAATIVSAPFVYMGASRVAPALGLAAPDPVSIGFRQFLYFLVWASLCSAAAWLWHSLRRRA